MNQKLLLDNLRCIPDFPQKGINFRDVTTLYQSGECLKEMTDALYELYKDKGITKIVGIESRGFIMASALATRLGCTGKKTRQAPLHHHQGVVLKGIWC